MLSRTIERDSSIRAARLTGLAFLAVSAPAVVLLIATGFIRGDYDLLIVGAVVLAGAIVAGAATAVAVLQLRLGQRSGLWATVLWLAAIVAPAASVLAILSSTATHWLHSSAIQDALGPNDLASLWTVALTAAGIASAALLGAGIVGDDKKPIVVRHRHETFTQQTVFAIAAPFFVALAALAATRAPRFASSDPDELRAQLPRLEREAARYPSHFRSQYLFGNALTHIHDCARAVDPLRRAAAIRPRDGWAQNDLGYALSCSQRFAEARAPYEEAVKLMPDQLLAQDGLAYVLEKLHDTRAESTYHAIVTRFPEDAYAAVREATLRFDRGQRDEGLDELRHALALGDTSFSVRLSAAQLFASAALLKEAAGQYRLLAATQPRDVWLWAQYGSTAYLAGALEEARSAFAHVDSIDARALASVDSWRMMRDAARRGVPPSALPPIPPTRPFTTVSSSPR